MALVGRGRGRAGEGSRVGCGGGDRWLLVAAFHLFCRCRPIVVSSVTGVSSLTSAREKERPESADTRLHSNHIKVCIRELRLRTCLVKYSMLFTGFPHLQSPYKSALQLWHFTNSKPHTRTYQPKSMMSCLLVTDSLEPSRPVEPNSQPHHQPNLSQNPFRVSSTMKRILSTYMSVCQRTGNLLAY